MKMAEQSKGMNWIARVCKFVRVNAIQLCEDVW